MARYRFRHDKVTIKFFANLKNLEPMTILIRNRIYKRAELLFTAHSNNVSEEVDLPPFRAQHKFKQR